MTVARYDLNKCTGCKNCVTICPMDVFRFDSAEMKSVIAYPESCQSCGQCFVNCEGRSLIITLYEAGQPITSYRAVETHEEPAA